MQVGPQHSAVDFLRDVHQVMVVVPVNAHVQKAEQVSQENGDQRFEVVQRRASGMCSSSTMIVMIMAITPSLKASSRLVVILCPIFLLKYWKKFTHFFFS